MRDFYCFDITFPNIDLDSLMANSEKSNLIHHSHLYSKENEIELRIFYNSKTYFGRKLSLFLSTTNWQDFGKYIVSINEHQNDRLKKIDFSNSSLLGLSNDRKQTEGEFEYIVIRLNSIKFYWNPVESEVDTAEFYTNEAGFKLVQDFYGCLFGWGDGKFDIGRMDGMKFFYLLDKAEFRPEFDFSYGDDKNKATVVITKEPKIKFKYKESVTEDEAMKYADIVRILSSFYSHLEVNYTTSRIHLKEHTIVIKTIQSPSLKRSPSNLWGFKNYWDFDKFLQSEWQKSTLENYTKLAKVIEKFSQALLVDGSSSFLIRFAILEICMGGTTNNSPKFSQILRTDENTEKYNEALSILLQTINVDDHKDFKTKWSVVKTKLEYKPMKSPMIEFLEKQGLDLTQSPISFEKLKKLRDDIAHGSISSINSQDLKKANILLYRITGILILNQMGISNWKLDTELK